MGAGWVGRVEGEVALCDGLCEGAVGSRESLEIRVLHKSTRRFEFENINIVHNVA